MTFDGQRCRSLRRPPYAALLPAHLWAITDGDDRVTASAHTSRSSSRWTPRSSTWTPRPGPGEQDAVEAVLRYGGRRRVASLPAAGDTVDWVPPNWPRREPQQRASSSSSDRRGRLH